MLTTVAKVTASLQSSKVGLDNTLIARLIAQVGARLESATNRFLTHGERTETRDGNGRTFLYLRGYPVHAIAEVKIDDEVEEDYQSNLDFGELYRTGRWAKGYQNISVKYTAGWDAETVGKPRPPADLEGAVIAEVVAWHDAYKAQTRTGQDMVDIKTPFLTKAIADWVQENTVYIG